MRHAARLLPGVAALSSAYGAAARASSIVLSAVRQAATPLQCLAALYSHEPVIHQWLGPRAIHSSSRSSSTSSSSGAEHGTDDKDSTASSGTTVHVNPISLDQLLQNAPLAAHGSSSSSEHSTRQQLTEQLLSELFDAELEQRLLSAAAAARSSPAAPASTSPDAATQQHPAPGSSSSSSSEANSESAFALPDAATGLQQTQQAGTPEQQQQQQRFQPGVAPAAPGRAVWDAPQQHSTAGRCSSSPPRVAAWHPLMSTDPWAPLPSPALAR
jgi:hypothetical protein